MDLASSDVSEATSLPPSLDSNALSSTLPPPSESAVSFPDSSEEFTSANGMNAFEIGDVGDSDYASPVALSDPNNHSLPEPEELKMNAASSGSTSSCLWPWCMGLVMLIVAVSIGVVVGLTTKDTNDPLLFDDNFVVDVREDEKAAMKAYIIEHGVSSQSAFSLSTSPQSRALTFLGDMDPLRLETPTFGLNSAAGYTFITRYVMALFYYAMNGDAWNYDLFFLSQHETCDWIDEFGPEVGALGVICNSNKEIVGMAFVSNGLYGSIPSELGVLTTLIYFQSLNNNMQGQLPSQLQKLTNLATVILAYNELSGTIPSWINTWSALEFFYLSNNKFSGSLPTSIQSLKYLKVLALDDNLLTGSIDHVWELSSMEYLYVDNCQFSGSLPSNLAELLPNLNTLDLSSNNFYGNLPTDLFLLSRLQILDLHHNSFTGAIPNDIPSNDMLYYISMHENSLEFAIPTEIGNLHALQHLDLSTNVLTGDIPTQMQFLSRLTYLFLARNPMLTPGTVPDYFYSYSQLVELSLKETKRTGKLLPSINNWSNLVLLDLDYNDLTGSIPTEIGTLTNLEFLLLNRNMFSENFPTEVANLSKLRLFFIDNNSVSGTLSICGSSSLELAIYDCGEASCSCCTSCCTDGTLCHDNDLVPSSDPMWETNYKRQFFDFSNKTGNFDVTDDEP